MNQDDSFDQQLEVVLQRLETIRQQTSDASGSQQMPVTEALEELSITLEELQVAGHELHQQNEELVVTCQSVEAERQRYQELFEFAPDSYLVTDAEGVIQEANYAAATLLNRDQSFLRGKPLVLFVAREDRQNFHAHLTRLQEEAAARVEDWAVQLEPNARPPFPATMTVTAVHDPEGRLTSLRWQLRDSTGRKQVEKALRESEQRFRTVADFTYDWEYWRGPDGNLLYISPSCKRISGYRPEEFLKDPRLLRTIAYPEDRNRVAHHLLNERGSREAHSVDFRIITRSGDVRWIGHVCQPVYDTDGTFLGRRASNRDISERKQAEQTIDRHVRRLEILRKLDQAILTAQSPEAIAQVAFDHLQRLVPWHRASVVVFASEANEAMVVAAQTADVIELGERTRLPLEMFKGIEELRSGQVHQVKDILALPQPSPVDQVLQAKGVRAYLNIPLIAEGELLGILNLGLDRPGLFTPEQVKIAHEVANQLALATWKAHLDKQIQRHTTELEQRVAERTAELGQERNFISAILDTASALVVVVDTQGRIVRFNRACERITGYTFDEVNGKYFWDLFLPPAEKESIKAVFKQLRAGQFPNEYENHWVAKDGSRRLISWSNTVLLNDEDSVEYVVGTGIDITRRRQMEEAYRMLVEHSLQGLAIIQDFRVVFANPTLAQITGYTLEELLSFSPEEAKALVHPEDQATIWERARNRLAGKPAAPHYEFRFVRKDGQVRWLETYISHIQYRGKPAAQVSIIDITQRKQAEQALAEERNLLRTLIDNLPDYIYVKDTTSRFVVGNLAAGRVMGETTPDGLIGKTDFDFYPQEVAAQYYGDEQEVIRSGEPLINQEELAIDSAGNRRWVLTTKVPLRDSQGQIVGIVGIGRDITERKLAEDEKAQLLEAVSQQSEQLRALTRRLAEVEEADRKQLTRELHDQVGSKLTALDFKLNTIQTWLASESPASASIQPHLDDSLALVEETAECIRDVMANLRPPMLDDYGLVAALRWYGDRFASWTGLTVTVQDEDLAPRLAVPLENTLFRIAQEALNNVAKHAQASEVTMTVEMDRGIVRLVVTDNGVGFDSTLATSPVNEQGWGLLSMAERAEMVGGRCRIESSPGQGTQVVVEVVK